jgi:hypothetical protein
MATEPTKPQTDEQAEARRRVRERLAALDAEWTPQRWEQARAEQADQLVAVASPTAE